MIDIRYEKEVIFYINVRIENSRRCKDMNLMFLIFIEKIFLSECNINVRIKIF